MLAWFYDVVVSLLVDLLSFGGRWFVKCFDGLVCSVVLFVQVFGLIYAVFWFVDVCIWRFGGCLLCFCVGFDGFELAVIMLFFVLCCVWILLCIVSLVVWC